ncbi:rod shape-determining protein RodA [Undibacterium sp. LX40W]|uniref:Peptidoglycan glycosyltransferase MrdB n=1 Tax=Undibacterium nitidum TaxID=2762298 RepID=A0A923HPU6_9BURK|nr:MULTISPECIES: rod shape-determining protein RodA [Undibacterium]MBC3881708.1 rod shape-determining protein RodA [Undibacterium nitidum]MBC3892295.1 rod shape-determining protein RodA [Undibacterium sp. LX40W]
MENKSVYWQRFRAYFMVFDVPLAILIFLIVSTGIVTMYSAGIDFPGRLENHLRNIVIAFFVMWFIANVPPQTLMRFAIPIYAVGVSLLIAVALFGVIKKGARRWLHIGFDIQPSEILKIAVPLMLAWYFQKREGTLRWKDFGVAALILAIPLGLIVKQPDLGTALLVGAVGFTVIFLAGLSWRLLIGLFLAALILVPTVVWPRLHDYQKDRVMIMLDPTKDALGKGFHIIQSIIAVGSGGTTGKGWKNGTQSHLEFIPEHTTDFISAVYLEEFGFFGSLFLVTLYFLVVVRGLMIAANAPTMFARLMAGAVTAIFFTYAFVNLGMVVGILPVVGVPLPFVSFGGTAMMTLGMGLGILMSVQHHRGLMKS